MKKLISLILALTLTVLMAGCETKSDEVITIYNNSQYPIDCIAIAPESDVLNSEDKIVLFDFTKDMIMHEALTANDYKIEVPSDLLDDTWYLYVSGANENYIHMYILEAEVGAIFENEVYGFRFDYDDEAENYVIIPLSGV